MQTTCLNIRSLLTLHDAEKADDAVSAHFPTQLKVTPAILPRNRYNGVVTHERIGRYEILDTLGKGSMGVVYLARDPIIDRRVALKTLRIDVDPDYSDEFRERFFREAKAVGRLNHPGIVTIHDVGECPETGLVYIAMEYIKGQDLKKMLGPDRRLHPAEAARIAAEVALALDYAHNLGVVHRDIKPANIILTTDGSPKVMDFGVARLESSNLTTDGQFIGTPNFMAPEQIMGKPVDGRSDIFSLGVVLFNLLTGTRPFSGANMHEVTLKITQEACPIPSTVVPGLPAAFNPIVLKCLEKDPNRRYRTGAELAEVLGALARALTPRPDDDAGRTSVTSPQPASEPRTDPTDKPEKKPSTPVSGLIETIRNIPVPEWVHWPVEGRWAAAIIAGCFLIALIPLVILNMKIDHGPWPSPSGEAVLGRHWTVSTYFRAREALARGDLVAAETTCLQALHQAPASPGGRALAVEIHRALEAEETILSDREHVETLVNEGRDLYRKSQYRAAVDRFQQALEIDATNELAASYLELASERLRTTSQRRSRPTGGTKPTSTTSVARPRPTRARAVPTPGLVRIHLRFDSPLNSGHLTVMMDGESLEEIPFDFSRKALLGIKRKGTGTIKRTLIAPSGRHVIGIKLSSPQLKTAAEASFSKNLVAGSQWSLRTDLPSEKATPSFFLIKVD